MDWKADLAMLAVCYRTWPALAEDLPVEIEGDALRRYHAGYEYTSRYGDPYSAAPSEEVCRALRAHRERLHDAHRTAGQLASRCKQVLHWMRAQSDLSQEAEQKLDAKMKVIDSHVKSLIWS